jgi:hypothetical protein
MPRLPIKVHRANRMNISIKEHIHSCHQKQQQQFQIFKPYTKHRAYIWNNNRYYGCHKDRHLNTLEKYHIYKISRNNLHMNNTYNPVLQILQKFYDRQQHRHLQKRITLKAYTSDIHSTRGNTHTRGA